RAARPRAIPRPDELPPEAGPLHRVGRGRARGPRAAAPSHRPDRPAPGPVRPDVLPAARDPGRMARRHAVRACRCECARQVRAALGAVAVTNLLLAQDFPPMGGGIARLHGEMAKRYPAGQLVVSTPQDPDAADFDAQLDGIVDRLPVGRRRVVHLGTDPGRFMPGVDPTELRERLGLPEDGVRWMLTVARLTPHKGADTVLRALPAILEHAPDVRYAVAGSGPALDQLEELASAIGVA